MVDYVDSDFEKRYRLTKTAVQDIARMLNSRLEYVSNRNFPVPVVDQVLTALRFYATGTFQLVVGDLSGIHQTTAGRIVKRVTIALAERSKEFIKMPSSVDEINRATSEFMQKKDFPNTIGVIDGNFIALIYCTFILFEYFSYRNTNSYNQPWRRQW